MDIRHSVHLLSVAVAAIIGLLFLVAAYTVYDGTAAVVSVNDPTVSTSTPKAASHPGKKVWKDNNCGSCHAGNMVTDATGPALSGVTARWADYPAADLNAWIINSGKLIATGHPRANELIRKWKRPMPAYPELTDAEISDLLSYIESR